MFFRYTLKYFFLKKSLILCFSLYMLCIYTYHYSYAMHDNIDSANKLNKEKFVSLKSDFIPDPLFLSKLQDKNNTIIHVVDNTKSSLISTVVDMKLIQSSHFVDATDCLKNIPGFSTIRNGGTNNDLIFRGMHDSRIKVLTDNAEIIGACCTRMDPPTAYINPETFDVLNIIKGPQTVLYGPTVSGGTLQFKRYRPAYFNVSKIQLHSDVTVGSYDSISRNIDSTFGNKYGYIRLIGNLAKSDDYYDGHNNKVHSAWNKWNADAILAYTIKELDTYIEMNIGQGSGMANYATKVMDGLCFDRENYGLKIETIDVNYLLSKIEFQIWHTHIFHLMAQKKFHVNSIQQKPLHISSNAKHCCSQKSLINGFDRFLWGIRSIVTYEWENIHGCSGIDSQINYHKKNQKYNNYYPMNTLIQDIGIFSECSYDLFSNQKLIGGARIEYTTNNVYIKYQDCVLNKYHMIYPMGFIRYESNMHALLSYSIGIGTSQRFPDYWELMSCSIFSKEQSKMNQIFQLKPEKTVQIDVGMNFKNANTNIQISSYAGYIKDYIFYYKNKNDIKNNINNYVNNVSAKILGSEIVFNYKFNDYWSGKSNISWEWGINSDDQCILPTVSPPEGKLILQFQKKNYFLETSWRLVSPSKYIQYNIFSLPFIFHRTDYFYNNDNNTEGFGIFSISFTWKSPKYTTYSIGIDNLLNHNYIEYFNKYRFYESAMTQQNPIYEPGRTWWFTVRTNL